MKKIVIAPMIVSVLALAIVYVWGGIAAFLLAAMLAVLEITLSIDNAVVNAKVLEKMPPRWQKRFLTWGMVFSVGAVRVILPILIVSAVSFASPVFITKLALFYPSAYGALIVHAGPAIDAFGGMFLFLVAGNFFLDDAKETHWFYPVEKYLALWGEVKALEVVLALATLLLVSFFVPVDRLLILESGLVGILLFLLMQTGVEMLGSQAEAAHSGFALFIYINMLDAAFSLDGVVGAFAITTLVPVIIVGLGIGAYFVRSMTMLLVQGGKLRELAYLEHGAHWAIFALSILMLLSLVMEISEGFIASTGLLIVAVAYVSSRRELRRTL